MPFYYAQVSLKKSKEVWKLAGWETAIKFFHKLICECQLVSYISFKFFKIAA